MKKLVSVWLSLLLMAAPAVRLAAPACAASPEPATAETAAEPAVDADDIMPIAGEPAEPAFTLTPSRLTMRSRYRSFTLQVYMDPYLSLERNHWICTSSDESVVTVEQMDMKSMTNGIPAQVKLWAKAPGTATITVSPDTSKWSASSPAYGSATCTVTVTQAGSTWGMTLDQINEMGPDEASKLSIYDPRDLEIMSPVNLQIGGICGMEGNIAAMETSLLRQGLVEKPEDADMLERNLVYRYYNHTTDPVGYSEADNNVNYSWAYFPVYIHPVGVFMTQWNGPVHDDGSTDPERYKEDGYDGCFAMPEDVVYPYGDEAYIKKIIAEYGGIAFGYESPPQGIMYHKYNTKGLGWHCSAIVGWDDTVDRSLFTVPGISQSTPLHNGAWIVKNSWGTENAHGDGHGYFYLSYEAGREQGTAYKMMLRDTYDFNYFYDGTVVNEEFQDIAGVPEGGAAAVSFRAKMCGDPGKSEYLEAVNVGTSSNCDVTVEVYTNVDPKKLTGENIDPISGNRQPAATATRTVPAGGFYTVRLGYPIELEQSQYYTVVVKISDGKLYCVNEKSTDDLTFVGTKDGVWNNTHPNTLRIKAFTKLHTKGEIDPPAATPEPTPSPSPTPTPTPTPTAEPAATPTATPASTFEPTATPVTAAMPGANNASPPAVGTAGSSATKAPPLIPATGDELPLAPCAGLLALCTAGLAMLLARGSRNRHE